MLPIVRFPQIIEEQAAWFDPVFATAEQRKHFREYITGLIVRQRGHGNGHQSAILGAQ